jgi:hypothetical protein
VASLCTCARRPLSASTQASRSPQRVSFDGTAGSPASPPQLCSQCFRSISAARNLLPSILVPARLVVALTAGSTPMLGAARCSSTSPCPSFRIRRRVSLRRGHAGRRGGTGLTLTTFIFYCTPVACCTLHPVPFTLGLTRAMADTRASCTCACILPGQPWAQRLSTPSPVRMCGRAPAARWLLLLVADAVDSKQAGQMYLAAVCCGQHSAFAHPSLPFYTCLT